MLDVLFDFFINDEADADADANADAIEGETRDDDDDDDDECGGDDEWDGGDGDTHVSWTNAANRIGAKPGRTGVCGEHWTKSGGRGGREGDARPRVGRKRRPRTRD